MTDKDILELAAKAAGLKDARWDSFYPAVVHTSENGIKKCPWNPLSSDAEAFRLAVKLGMELNLPVRKLEVSGASVWFDGRLIHHMIWMDEDADEFDFMDAARRNIVAVAADVGKAMP